MRHLLEAHDLTANNPRTAGPGTLPKIPAHEPILTSPYASGVPARQNRLRWPSPRRCATVGHLSERGQSLSRKSIYYLVSTAGQSAGLPNVHPHTLRHSCGYHLADKGTDLRTQDYLGHRDPRHTVHYSRITGRRFEGLWR